MYIPEELLRFVRAHRDELTLSVYVESVPADPAARRNWRVRLRQGLNEAREKLSLVPQDEHDAFERCVAEVSSRIPAGETPPSRTGWACFAAAGGDTIDLPLPDALETTVHWGIGARLVPYLRIATEDHALVVQVDREHARIARWHDGALELLESHEAPAPHPPGPHLGAAPRHGFHVGTRGPTGTDEEQRQKDEAVERLLSTARQRLVALAEPQEPVLVGGASEASAHLVEALPPDVASHALAVPGLTMHTEGAAVAPVVREGLITLADRMRTRRIGELREEAHENGRAAVGYAPANAAAQMGALAELIFSEGAWRRHPEEIEDLVRRALLEGARVAVATGASGPALDGEDDGIIAGLRFPLPALR